MDPAWIGWRDVTTAARSELASTLHTVVRARGRWTDRRHDHLLEVVWERHSRSGYGDLSNKSRRGGFPSTFRNYGEWLISAETPLARAGSGQPCHAFRRMWTTQQVRRALWLIRRLCGDGVDVVSRLSDLGRVVGTSVSSCQAGQ